jgi:hypothetical protein
MYANGRYWEAKKRVPRGLGWVMEKEGRFFRVLKVFSISLDRSSSRNLSFRTNQTYDTVGGTLSDNG